MGIQLKNIIDLDYLLSLDEKQLEGPERQGASPIRVRDRKIYGEITSRGWNEKETPEKELILAWLEQRRRKVEETSGPEHLPGHHLDWLFRWSVRLFSALGLFLGFGAVYSFLAYHGVRPVNVTLFFTLFVLLPFLLFVVVLFLLLHGIRGKNRPGTGRASWGSHGLFISLAFRGLPWLLRRAGAGGLNRGVQDRIDLALSIVSQKKETYGRLFFWPALLLSSLFAVGFSLGTLGGTFFRVVTSDMAFGWQSSLVAGSAGVHDLVSWMALPWSWLLPHGLPTPEQIDGSRIILKQGIAALATEHLVAWWPFLCLGILFYAVLPRACLVLVARIAGGQRVNQFDFSRPRFRKLLIRMRSPIMDVQFKETRTSQAGPEDFPLPDPAVPMEKVVPFKTPASVEISEPVETQPLSPIEVPQTEFCPPEPGPSPTAMAQAALLAPMSVFDEAALSEWALQIHRELMLDVQVRYGIDFDLGSDRAVLEPFASEMADDVVILQEIWQPPIRGLLYYFVQLADTVLAGKTLWILLVQTPGGQGPANDGEDLDAQVWFQAIQKLGHPNIVVERLGKERI